MQITYGLNPNDGRPLHVTSPLGAGFYGGSGTGKSSHMKSFIKQYAQHKEYGMLIIFWHDELPDVVGAIPKDQHERCRIISGSPENKRPPGFDIFRDGSSITQDLVYVITKLFNQGDNMSGFGEQMKELASLGIEVFSRFENSTIAHLRKAMSDTKYFERAVNSLNDSNTKLTFTNQLSRVQQGRESFTSVANRIRHFTADGIRNLFCQLQPTVRIKELLDKIVILDLRGLSILSQSALSATMLLLFYAALKERYADVTEQVKPFIFFCDEAANYFTPGIDDMLAEGRKFGMSMFCATQYLSRFNVNTLNSIMASLHKIVFRISGQDAYFMRHEMGVPSEELVSLPNYHCYTRGETKKFYLRGLHCPDVASEEEIDTIRKITDEEIGGSPVEFDDKYYGAIFKQQSGQTKSMRVQDRVW